MVVCVTDLIKDGSYIFFDESSKGEIANAFGFEDINQGYFFEKCLSRKKQLAPIIMSVVK